LISPFNEPLADNQIERARQFAKDLAYGVAMGYWSSNFLWDVFWRRLTNNGSQNEQIKIFTEKWGVHATHNSIEESDKLPNPILMQTLEYISNLRFHPTAFILTKKSLDLLTEITKSAHIFVSYGHRQSSALALLVEARCKVADSNAEVFIDKAIPLGDDWHGHLEERVKQSEYFICLLGTIIENGEQLDTIASPYVRQEIIWAIEASVTTIFVCHNGYQLPTSPDSIPLEIWDAVQMLSSKQGIVIDQESAEEYEFALNKILNRLGYPTY
jgi:hypothetical protein